jgi:hypothetical protein
MTPPLPANTSFGRSCTGVFAGLGIFSLCTEGVLFPLWFALSTSAAALAMFRPDALEWPNRAWAEFMDFVRREIQPVVVRAVFLCVLVPVGNVMKRLAHARARRK